MFCLSGFYYGIYQPTKRNTLALMKALSEYERDPCWCEQCTQIQVSLAALLRPHYSATPLPLPTSESH